jgi:hypothetical protein
MANRTLLRSIAVFGALCVLVLSYGCSGSNKATNDNTNTSNLDELQGFVSSDFYTMSLQSLDLSLSLLDSVPAANAPDNGAKTRFEDLVAANGNDLVINSVSSYAYQNGWHIFQFAATIDPGDGSGLSNVSGVDSVQALQNGQPMGPGSDFSMLDDVTSHAHFSWETQDQSTSVGANQLVNVGISVSGADTTFLVNGSLDESIDAAFQDSVSSCSFAIDYAAVVNNLAIAGANDCPQSGSVSMDVGIDIACLNTGNDGPQSTQLQGSFNVTAVANGASSITVTYSDGVNTKMVTDQCGGAMASPWSRPQM